MNQTAPITYRALLVGNATFPEDPILTELSGPGNDLRTFADALTHPEVGLHARENVTSLYNATRGEVEGAAGDFFHDAGRDDQLLFYYSGHGRLDNFSNLYLTTRDTRTERLPSTAVSAQTLNAMIMNSRSRRVVIILDCCHSGAFKGGLDIPPALCGDGRFVITSSRAQQLSDDAKHQEGLSAFTRYLVEALLTGGVDRNDDEYVSLNEVYDYVLPRLMDSNRQHPQRRFDEVVGDLALGRCINAVRRIPTASQEVARETDRDPRGGGQDERPVLAVSTEEIRLDDVDPSESLPEEVIDVFNLGGGELEWTVTCNDEWISIEKHRGFFTVRLSPAPGMNRGRIYVRDRNGATKRVAVQVRVLAAPPPPSLTLSQASLAFGNVSPSVRAAARTVELINTGAGQLNARVSSHPPWLDVRLTGKVVEIRPLTHTTGELEGQVVIDSDGGEARLDVSARIERGPVIAVDPRRISFDTLTRDDDDGLRTVAVTNSGDGQLEWSFEQHGDFFSVDRIPTGLEVELHPEPGRHRGSIFVRSNGGEATIDVEADVPWHQSPTPAPPPPVPHSNVNGTWNAGGLGTFVFSGGPVAYQYNEFNMFGVMCGQGMATLNGNMLYLQGHNIVAGPIEGWLTVQGNAMAGNIRGQFTGAAVQLFRVG